MRQAVCVMLTLSLLVASCSPKDEKLGLEIVGYNHTTNRSITTFDVDGNMGSNLGPETGGGGFTCCVPIPVRWHEGLQVKVRWKYQNFRDEPAPEPRWREAEVQVPRYGSNDFSRLAVHFFPDHKVKVLVTRLAIRHADYPADLKWDAPTPGDATTGRPAPQETTPR